RALRIYGMLAGQAPRFAGWGLAVAEALAAGPAEVAIVGPVTDPRTSALRDAAVRSSAPGAAVVVGDPSDPAVTEVPLLRDRPLVNGVPAAYVCRGFVCRTPVTDPDALAAELAA